MGTTGNTDDDTAASLLSELYTAHRKRRVTGPAGHSYIPSGPRSTRTVPGAPVDLTVVDRITASIREVVDETLAVNPEPSPLSDPVRNIYGWFLENTANAQPAQARRRDTLLYRHRLEHAIAVGDIKVVRPHRCPACRCFGLMWSSQHQRAVCTNGRCLTREGLSHKWTLAKLAYEHVAAKYENSVRDCAT